MPFFLQAFVFCNHIPEIDKSTVKLFTNDCNINLYNTEDVKALCFANAIIRHFSAISYMDTSFIRKTPELRNINPP